MAARSVLIIGGGIAGLACATAARRTGQEVEVIEIRPGWEVAGWGLSLTGPALRALRTLGLDKACLAGGYPIYRTFHCDETGQVRATMESRSLLGPEEPGEVGMGRPALQRILRERAEAAGATLRTGLSVTDLPPEGPVRLSDGSTRTVDYVVGADGVRSQTRTRLGLGGVPSYPGQMVWRALVDRPEWATDLYTFAGPAETTGLIPISRQRAYIFLTESTDTPEMVPEGRLATRMRELLAPFSGRFAQVRDTIRQPGQVVRRPVQALFLDGPWHAGQGVLIGDAAHSPSPQMVSGAALAIEDAVVLNEELSGKSDLTTAFQAYQRRRHERAKSLVETSIEIGRRERQGRHQEVQTLLRTGHAAMAAHI